MRTRKDVLADFSNEKRQKAMGKYFLIEPCLMQQESLTGISKQQNIPLRTLQRWKKDYKTDGLVGLIHRSRSDAGKIRIDESILSEIERLLLQHKKMSIATIHRKICSYCEEQGNTSPSYGQVYRFVKSIYEWRWANIRYYRSRDATRNVTSETREIDNQNDI